MIREALVFAGPRRVRIAGERLKPPGRGEVRVETSFSGISAGTELLIYRGQAPKHLAADENLSHLSHRLHFPLHYGYSAVGRVVQWGRGVPRAWKGRRIFAFHPHADGFISRAEDLHPVPEDLSDEASLFLPNMESALNFVMDGAPVAGERVVILGQGVVGLLTTALLSRFPLAFLLAADNFSLRRRTSVNAGAADCLDGGAPGLARRITRSLGGEADLVFELSGNPRALQTAVDITAFGGRVVLGSWYGRRKMEVNLGGAFHRKRITILNSQVTTVSPALSGRFSKARRLAFAWEMIRRVNPSRWISHRFPFDRAAEAFELLDRRPGLALQTVLVY